MLLNCTLKNGKFYVYLFSMKNFLKNDCVRARVIKDTWVLSFSKVTHSGGSQLPCHEDTQAARWRSPSAAEPPANSQPELIIHVRVSITEGDPWPQASLPMTAALLADI